MADPVVMPMQSEVPLGIGHGVYLDGHATTPLAPEAFEAMQPWWHARVANAHSPHARGQHAASAVEDARGNIAHLAGSAPQEIYFTSGATEANNIAIRGTGLAALAGASERRRLVVSSIEHKSVLAAAESLIPYGFEVLLAPVGRNGVIDLDRLATLIDERTLLVSVMAVNNEIGTMQPIDGVREIAERTGAMVHVDAAQAAGKVALDLTHIDLASLSSHKIYGPPGIGALHVSSSSRIRPSPLVFGGQQERGLRPGTVPVPLAVGFGAAAALAVNSQDADRERAVMLKARFRSELMRRGLTYMDTVSSNRCLPASLSIRFSGFPADEVLGRLGARLAISEGSACSSGQITPSHVLSAIGLTSTEASETLRIFFSRYNSIDDVTAAALELERVLLR